MSLNIRILVFVASVLNCTVLMLTFVEIEIIIGKKTLLHKKTGNTPKRLFVKPMTAAEAEEEFYKKDDGTVFLKCITCNETFSSVHEWVLHQTNAHEEYVGWATEVPVPNPAHQRRGRRLPCPICWNILVFPVLKQHIKAVHQNLVCVPCPEPGCDKSFRWASTLKTHSRLHQANPPVKSKEKTHLCLLCGATFLGERKLLFFTL